MATLEFFLNVKKYFSLEGLESSTSCIGDQDASTAQARCMWGTELSPIDASVMY